MTTIYRAKNGIGLEVRPPQKKIMIKLSFCKNRYLSLLTESILFDIEMIDKIRVHIYMETFTDCFSLLANKEGLCFCLVYH